MRTNTLANEDLPPTSRSSASAQTTARSTAVWSCVDPRHRRVPPREYLL